MLIFDILVYVIIAMIMYNFTSKSYQFNPTGANWDKYLRWFFLFFFVIAGIRWGVGSDSRGYAMGFANGIDVSEHERTETLWFWFVNGLHALRMPHWIGLGLTAVIPMYLLCDRIKDYKYILVMLPFVLIGGRYWIDLMGACRQMVVAYAFFWATRFIRERSLWKYLLFIFISQLIHHSAVMLIPFYFVPVRWDITRMRWLLTVGLFASLVIGLTPAFQSVINYAEGIANLSGYEDYTENVVDMLQEGQTNEALSFGPMMISYLLIPLFLIWFGPQLKREYGNKIPYFSLWFLLAYFYACAYFLVSNISHIFIRPIMYFSPFQMVMASLLLWYLYQKAKVNVNIRQCFYVFVFIVAINTSWAVYKAVRSGSKWESTVYKVYFMHMDQVNAVFESR